jgi:hypothetical protein
MAFSKGEHTLAADIYLKKMDKFCAGRKIQSEESLSMNFLLAVARALKRSAIVII